MYQMFVGTRPFFFACNDRHQQLDKQGLPDSPLSRLYLAMPSRQPMVES